MIRNREAFFKMSQETMDNRLSDYLREVIEAGERPNHETLSEAQHVAELYNLPKTLALANKLIEAVHS